MRYIDSHKIIEKLGKQLPPEYYRRKEEIEGETNLLVLRCSLENREARDEEIRKIVDLKLDLDRFLGDWVEA